MLPIQDRININIAEAFMGFAFDTVVFLGTERSHFKAPQPNMASQYSTKNTGLHPFRVLTGLNCVVVCPCLEEFCLGAVSEHWVDTEQTKGNEGAGGWLREFLGLRKGSAWVKMSWREAC